MKRAIITGATGAVGMALIDKLTANQVEVLVIARKGSARVGQIGENSLVTKIEADLSDYALLQNGTGKQWDVCYHLAWAGTTGNARNDTSLQMQNAVWTLDCVRMAKRFGCRVFIGAGSQAEYGRREEKLTAQTAAFPETGYGIAKLAAGQMSRLLCGQLSMRHVWMRILSVYGPYDGKQSMVMSAAGHFLKGEKTSFTEGKQRWDYLYSKDAANALYLAGKKAAGEEGERLDGKVYCLGSGKAEPLRESIMKIRNAAGQERGKMPPMPGFGEIPYGPGQVMYLCADIGPLIEDVGFEPAYTFEEGIRETIDWTKKQCTGEYGDEENQYCDTLL